MQFHFVAAALAAMASVASACETCNNNDKIQYVTLYVCTTAPHSTVTAMPPHPTPITTHITHTTTVTHHATTTTARATTTTTGPPIATFTGSATTNGVPGSALGLLGAVAGGAALLF